MTDTNWGDAVDVTHLRKQVDVIKEWAQTPLEIPAWSFKRKTINKEMRLI